MAPLLSDRQINDLPKKIGEQVFSPDGKTAGANHTKYGGNVAFINGEVKKSPQRAEFDLSFPKNIILLEPRR